MTVTTLAAANLADTVSTRLLVAIGLAATGVAAVLLLIGALSDMPLPVAPVGFFVLMSAQRLVGPNAGALASGLVPDQPGTGSALLGLHGGFFGQGGDGGQAEYVRVRVPQSEGTLCCHERTKRHQGVSQDRRTMRSTP